MYGKQFSNAFIAQQRKDKTGENNHMSKAILLINLKTNESVSCESQTQAGGGVGAPFTPSQCNDYYTPLKFLRFKSKIPVQRAMKNKTNVYSKDRLSCWKVQYAPLREKNKKIAPPA